MKASLSIPAVAVSINSPGGSVSASQNIYMLFQKFKEENKITIYFNTSDILASGGYWVSLSGDKIFASYGALIGSIGVKGPDWLYYNSPTSLSTGILVGIIYWSLGLDLAFIFGTLTFLLNFIPTIGSIIAILLPLPVAFLQFDLPIMIILVIVLPIIVHTIIGNIIEPKVFGKVAFS